MIQDRLTLSPDGDGDSPVFVDEDLDWDLLDEDSDEEQLATGLEDAYAERLGY